MNEFVVSGEMLAEQASSDNIRIEDTNAVTSSATPAKDTESAQLISDKKND